MNIQYIPLDLDIIDDAKMIRVVRKYGMQGFGIYIRIIILLWKREDDGFRWGLDEEYIEDLYEALRDKSIDRDVMEDILLHHGLFEKDITEGLPGYFYSKSILRRREKMQTKKEILSSAGKKGMKSRWGNKQDITNIKDSNKVVITNKEKKTKVKEIKLNISFDEIWNLYDYKTGTKDKLNKKWESLTDIEREDIFKDIPLYKAETPDKKFRKHFSTYLNQRGWEDERNPNSNGVTGFEYDGTGNFRKGYCDKCNGYASYRDEELFGETRCCNAKILKRKKLVAVR